MPLAVKPKLLKLTALAAGLLCLLLRAILFATGLDMKGLLVAGHWAGTCSWLLTAGIIGLIFFTLRTVSGPPAYSDAFPSSPIRAAGSLVAACGFALSGVPAAGGPFASAELVLRILAAAALVAAAYCRFRGKKASVLLHSAVCLYLALRMVCLYQRWSADPQLQHYVFYLGAHLALMLCSYQLAAFGADSGNHKSLWGWGLASIYLCLGALPGSEDPFFLLCCAIWMFTGLSSLTPAANKGD